MKRAPAFFIGHGSPMNVIEDNQFNKNIREIGKKIDWKNIKGIICLSAHWQTSGTQILSNESLETIYDFYGFPEILYTLKYPAQGSKKIATDIKDAIAPFESELTSKWGLDHGAWNILWHLYPKSEIPIVMVSLNYDFNFMDHFLLGKKLKQFRDRGYLILTSGNVVHSFKGIQFSPTASPHADAKAFNDYVEQHLREKNFDKLISLDQNIFSAAKFSINSSEHYLPLLYTLATLDENETINIFNNEVVFSTLSMLSIHGDI